MAIIHSHRADGIHYPTAKWWRVDPDRCAWGHLFAPACGWCPVVDGPYPTRRAAVAAGK
jgi:hypothetical protein